MEFTHLKEALASPRFLLIHTNDDNDAHDFATSILRQFGFSETGSCEDIQDSDEWDSNVMSDLDVEESEFEMIGIWSKGKAPTEKQVINALKNGHIVKFGD